MIRLHKSAEPKILSTNAASWTQNIDAKLKRGEKLTKADRSRYAHRDIKDALVLETSGKCAYCESKIRHVAPGDIEHVIPKSLVPQLWFEWVNLTLACSECNRRKLDHLGDDTDFVDPYDGNPEDHFWHLGATIFPAPGSEAAVSTENLLELNRADLLERRASRLSGLMRHLSLITATVSQTTKSILIADFLREAESDREYAGLARFIIKQARAKAII